MRYPRLVDDVDHVIEVTRLVGGHHSGDAPRIRPPDRRPEPGHAGDVRAAEARPSAVTRPPRAVHRRPARAAAKGDAYEYSKRCHPGAIAREWTREQVREPMHGKRRTTGMKKGIKESYTEDPANHGGPESCVGDPRGRSEALTGVHAGRLSSLEMVLVRGADALMHDGRQHRRSRFCEWPAGPAGSKNPSTCAISSC